MMISDRFSCLLYLSYCTGCSFDSRCFQHTAERTAVFARLSSFAVYEVDKKKSQLLVSRFTAYCNTDNQSRKISSGKFEVFLHIELLSDQSLCPLPQLCLFDFADCPRLQSFVVGVNDPAIRKVGSVGSYWISKC